MQSQKLAAAGLLAAGVMHEINNPLTAIIAYAQFLLKSELQERQRTDVEHIVSEAVRASRIVQNLLTFARPMRPQKGPIRINDAVASALDARRRQLALDDIAIHTALSPGLPLIEADGNQLQQVFINIINNARDAMLDHGDGGHRLSVSTYARDGRVCVSFDDTGSGIPDACADRIFDPFFTTKEVGRGSGLGLAVCHGIIREHGGSISAHNLPQGGTRFVVELPVTARDEP
jgi:two-component system NtrC family sensor kinase